MEANYKTKNRIANTISENIFSSPQTHGWRGFQSFKNRIVVEKKLSFVSQRRKFFKRIPHLVVAWTVAAEGETDFIRIFRVAHETERSRPPGPTMVRVTVEQQAVPAGVSLQLCAARVVIDYFVHNQSTATHRTSAACSDRAY